MKPHVFLSAICLLISLSVSSVNAQFPMGGGAATPPSKALPGTAGDQSPKGTARITGSVVDSTQAKAVEFASVALYNKTTDKAVDGTVADEKGKFALTKLVAGDYRVLISFVGFRNKTIETVTLANGQSLDLGTIQLSSSIKNTGRGHRSGSGRVDRRKSRPVRL